MTMLIFHADLDGRAAAAIAWRSELVNRNAELVEMDYKNPVPVDKIGIGEQVIIVDFSFSPEVMARVLERTKNVIWIDHHETAMNYPYNTPVMKGIRNVAYSGCELAWLYFAKSFDSMPRSVRMIGYRDNWKFTGKDEDSQFEQMVRNFNEGIKVFPHDPKDCIWDDLLGKEQSLCQLIDIGRYALKQRDQFCRAYRKLCGYETEFEGLKCYAINLYSMGSETFGDIFDKYDACIAFVYDGLKWQCSIYSQKHDVRPVALKYGGGGHIHAAGWVCSELPFKRV